MEIGYLVCTTTSTEYKMLNFYLCESWTVHFEKSSFIYIWIFPLLHVCIVNWNQHQQTQRAKVSSFKYIFNFHVQEAELL